MRLPAAVKKPSSVGPACNYKNIEIPRRYVSSTVLHASLLFSSPRIDARVTALYFPASDFPSRDTCDDFDLTRLFSHKNCQTFSETIKIDAHGYDTRIQQK